ncbi:MAG: F0F1 ATP synthase subunit delta [Pseudomonadota bacterium]
MSSLTTLARPYAKATFDVARAADALVAWEGALLFAAEVASDATVQQLVLDPNVDDTARRELFAIADGGPEGYDGLIALLAENDRLPLLPEIAILFSVLKDEEERKLAVTVRSASELDDEYRERLAKSLADRFGKDITLDVEIDPSVLGGAVIEAGDLVIDGSVRGKLDRLSAAMRGN